MTQEIQSLRAKIEEYNRLYRAGNPQITDVEYDTLISQLKEKDPDNDWFSHIEPAETTVGRKSKLPLPMKSLDKAKSIDEVLAWAKSLGLPKSTLLTVMPKFDGLSLLCDESTGMAWSRGGSENEGQNCSAHLQANNPGLHPESFRYTYGEFCFNVRTWKEQFEGVVAEDTGLKYKSPRNTAAGMLNRDVPPANIGSVDFFRYGADPDTTKNYVCFNNLIEDLCRTYGQEYLLYTTQLVNLNEKDLNALFTTWRAHYYIDGLVIYIDELRLWDVIGRHQTSGNPKYAIAYKHPDFTEAFESQVQDVEFRANKSGALKPVVKIEKVDIGDCVMDSPTGYNMRWIVEHDVAAGASVLVTRSGGVIPKILDVVCPANYEAMQDLYTRVSVCPHCGAPTKWNDTGVEICCTNPDCCGIKIAKIIFFFTTVGAENTGEETYRKLYAAGYDSVGKILHITFDELIQIDTFGPTTANNILNNNKKILEGIPYYLLVQASSCFKGIGTIKARQIVNEMSEIDRLNFIRCKYTVNESLLKYVNMMSATNKEFYTSLPQFYQFISDNGLTMTEDNIKVAAISDKLAGQVFCLTGFRNEDLVKEIVAHGGRVVESMSSKVTTCIAVSKTTLTGKAKKAKAMKIPIITPDEFEI